MGDTSEGGRGDVAGTHHASGQEFEDCQLKLADGFQTRMISSTVRQRDPSVPRLVQSARDSTDHPGKTLDALEFSHWRGGKNRLDGRSQDFAVDGSDEASRESDSSLLERHDLLPVPFVSSGLKSSLLHREGGSHNPGRTLDWATQFGRRFQ